MAIVALLFASCVAPRTMIAGADRDAHGCIGSAGYQWSAIRGECVRVWLSASTQLTSVKDSNKRAYVIFAADNTKAEIFADIFADALIVNRLHKNIFVDSTQKVTLTKGVDGWQITKDRRVVYDQF